MTQNTKTTEKRVFRKLEDLNLIDNFLFQAVLSDKTEGEEFARILLSTILGKQIRNVRIVPQKNVLGLDTDKHGIRLDAYIEDVSDELNSNLADVDLIPDVYDIEPNNSYEKLSLPKRIREDPSIPYDDGAKKIFLYTKGTEGNPSQALKDMLKYMENSTDDNVTNQDIASIQELVNKVKRKKEVGINYMKSWEMEELARKQGYNECQEKVNQLILLLAEAGRTEDIIKAAGDKTYQEKLFEEFNL